MQPDTHQIRQENLCTSDKDPDILLLESQIESERNCLFTLRFQTMLTSKSPLILSLVALFLSTPELAFSRFPDPDLLCFKRSPTGEIENLEGICPKKKIESPVKSSTNKSSAPAPMNSKRVEIGNEVSKDLEFLSSNFDGKRLVITFKNRTKKTLSNASISYTAIRGRQVVDTDKVRGNRDEIKPQEEVGFKTVLDREADIIKIIAVRAE